MKQALSLASLLLLAACQPAFINGVPNENSPYFQVPVDSRFVLTRAVTVPANQDSAHFQDGKSLRWQDVDIYGSWCVLKLDTKRPQPQVIEPDTFMVKKVWTESYFHLARAPVSSARVHLAANGMTRFSVLDREMGESRSYEVEATLMQLHSPTQPDVVRFVCAEWGVPQGGTFLTVAKIRATLGDYFRLELAGYPR